MPDSLPRLSDVVGVTTTAAVIASCDHCGARSGPLDPDHVHGWAVEHYGMHASEDRREQMADEHRVREVVEWMIEDDSSGHVVCSCGWRSRSVRANWLREIADGHLAEVAA